MGTPEDHGELRDSAVTEGGGDTPARALEWPGQTLPLDSCHSPFPTHLPLSHTHSSYQLKAVTSSERLAWTAAKRRGGRVGRELFLLWTPVGGRGSGWRCREQAQATPPSEGTPPF